MTFVFLPETVNLRAFALGIFAVSFLGSTLSVQAAEPSNDVAPRLITRAVNPAQLTPLPGNVAPTPAGSQDEGSLPAATPMHLMLVLKRSASQQKALDTYTAQVSDPNSANYHKWLTAQQFGQKYGISQDDLDAITDWLTSHNLTVDQVPASRSSISFSGRADQVQTAFNTNIHRIRVDGQLHFVNKTDPKIPSAFSAAVAGVKLNDFTGKPSNVGAKPVAPTDPSYTLGSGRYIGAQDLETIYNFKSAFSAGFTGQGQTIVVLERTNLFSASDWAQFRKQFGLTRPYSGGTYQEIHPSGTIPCQDPGDNADDFEATLDAEWASAAAPNAHIVLASCADIGTQPGTLIALQNLLNGRSLPPSIMSLSYQIAEDQEGDAGNAYINGLYQQAAVEGVSLFVASGDSGADSNTIDRLGNIATQGINANALASTPFNVAVGGTDFSDQYYNVVPDYWSLTNSPFLQSAQSYIPEIPWNRTCASLLNANYFGFATPYGANGFCNSSYAASHLYQVTVAGGGAPSKIYAKPAWQSAPGVPSDGKRDVPDVSLFASSGPWNHAFMVCFSKANLSCVNGYFYGGGGTSFSAPIMAGVQALVNQRTGTRAGNPNPIYYQMAQGAYNSSSCESTPGKDLSGCIFHDITLGDISVYCAGTINCFTDGQSTGVLSTSSSSYQSAYSAGTGWDFATGLGSIDVYNLVTNWPVNPTP